MKPKMKMREPVNNKKWNWKAHHTDTTERTSETETKKLLDFWKIVEKKGLSQKLWDGRFEEKKVSPTIEGLLAEEDEITDFLALFFATAIAKEKKPRQIWKTEIEQWVNEKLIYEAKDKQLRKYIESYRDDLKNDISRQLSFIKWLGRRFEGEK